MVQEHSIKIGGIKYRVRIVGGNEIITNRMVFSIKEIYKGDVREYYIQSGDWKRLSYKPTQAVGENTSEHPRLYLEILSGFYHP